MSIGAFVIGLSQISSFFSHNRRNISYTCDGTKMCRRTDKLDNRLISNTIYIYFVECPYSTRMYIYVHK